MNAYDTLARRFGENLRDARKQLGISQEELGFRADLHRTEVGIMERGVRLPRIDTLLKLSTALDSPLQSPLLDGIRWRLPITESGGFEADPANPATQPPDDG